MTIRTSTVTLKGGGQNFQAYLAEPSVGGPGILLLHAWWGLKPFFKETANRLAEQGFIVLAPDLHQGRVAAAVEEAQQMMDQSDSQLMAATVMVAKDYLLHYPALKGHKIAVVGFSMGAALALMTAARAPEEIADVVLFYGAGDVELEELHARVLGHFSDVDEWEPYAAIKAFEGKMKSAGVDVTFHTYPGLSHWWVEEDRPEYDPRGARLAWDRTIAFLKEKL